MFNSLIRRRIFKQGTRGMAMKHPEMFDANGKFIRPQRQASGQGNVFDRLVGRSKGGQTATINSSQTMQSVQGRNTLG